MKNETQATNAAPVILYGIDQHQKFRAALFPATQADIAARAAARMNLNSAPVNTKELEELAKELEPARAYEAGKGFIPYIPKAIYGKIVALAGPGKIENANVPADDDAGKKPKASANIKSKPGKASKLSAPGKSKASSAIEGLPKDWKDIRTGHLVIAQATKADGWWEAIVTDVKRDILTLRWRDYPKFPPFTCHRSTVAILRPDAG